MTKFILLLVSNLFWRCLIERKRHCLKEKPAEKVKDSMTWQKKLNNRVSHSINPKRLQLSIYSVEVGLRWTRILAPFTSMCVIELNTEHSVSNTFQQDRHHCFVRLVRKQHWVLIAHFRRGTRLGRPLAAKMNIPLLLCLFSNLLPTGLFSRSPDRKVPGRTEPEHHIAALHRRHIFI